MPFSYDVKKELCKIKLHSKNEIISQLYGFLLFSKSFSESSIVFTTENINVSNMFCNLIMKISKPQINIEEKPYIGGRKSLIIITIDKENDVKHIMDIINNFENTFNEALSDQDQRSEKLLGSFIRGAFLSCGTILEPEKEYRLEFGMQNETLANSLIDVIRKIDNLSVTPGLLRKKHGCIVYIKDSEQIYNILAFAGAFKSAMNFIQIKMLKEVRNYVNRTTNFQTANIEKTANAAAVQIEAIKKIDRIKGINYLSDDLKEVAMMRLENPEMSLQELGESLSKRVSRSGVNHRLKKIIEISKTLQ